MLVSLCRCNGPKVLQKSNARGNETCAEAHVQFALWVIMCRGCEGNFASRPRSTSLRNTDVSTAWSASNLCGSHTVSKLIAVSHAHFSVASHAITLSPTMITIVGRLQAEKHRSALRTQCGMEAQNHRCALADGPPDDAIGGTPAIPAAG